MEILTMKVNGKGAPIAFAYTLAAILMSGAIWIATARPAAATQQFATQTGQSCAACHTNPKGGGELTPVGQKFKANGNKMPAKADEPTSPK
jgi:mono/diheme cytochrome c family protein